MHSSILIFMLVTPLFNAQLVVPFSNRQENNKGLVYYTPETYPDSLKDYAACGLSQPGYICDPNKLLGISSNRANSYDSALRRIMAETECPCADSTKCYAESRGFTVSFALLENIYNEEYQKILDPEARISQLSTFAKALRKKQRRGQCDDDILVVISTSDSVIFTETSNGTSFNHLSPEDVEAINAKAFLLGRVHLAVNYISEEYKEILKGNPRPKPVAQSDFGGFVLPKFTETQLLIAVGTQMIVIFGLFIGMIVSCYFCLRRTVYTTIPQRSFDESSHTSFDGKSNHTRQTDSFKGHVISLPLNAVKLSASASDGLNNGNIKA
uniref:Uncharacterized protein n=1 Tax=Panagrellus redivivus TaxID=6233 RepID=A0A7E4W255_PANRE